MPRSNRPRRRGRPRDADEVAPLDVERAMSGVQRVEHHADGAWTVVAVSGAAATKHYRCPGCDQEIPPGTAHLVVWSAEPLGVFGGVGDRRHWHRPCWTTRARRGRG